MSDSLEERLAELEERVDNFEGYVSRHAGVLEVRDLHIKSLREIIAVVLEAGLGNEADRDRWTYLQRYFTREDFGI